MIVEARDADLVHRVGLGDKAAEAEVCRRMGPRIRLLPCGTCDPAEDLMQQVLLTTIEALRAGRERGVVLTFYDERTAADSGQALGLSEANVRVIRHRAIKQRRSCMEAAS